MLVPWHDVLGFDVPTAILAARISADLERRGMPVGVADVMIAAVAINNG